MIKGFRVSDLQSLLIYAGRNKGGKKSELQNRALDLIKLHSASIDMKIRELHMNRYQQARHADPPDMFPLAAINDPLRTNYSSTSNHKTSMDPSVAIPGYVQSINHQMMRSVPALNVMQQYAVNPDVKFKDLPFYDVLTELLKPTSLVPLRGDNIVSEKEMAFYMGPQDLRELDSSTDVQVQLRIGCLENNREQEDEFPSSICLKVNNKVASLPNPIPTNKPGVEPKRPKRPLDITNLIRRSLSEPQVVCVSWATTNNRPYVMGIFLVRKQTSSVLIKRLKDNGVRNPDHTTAMIKEKLCHNRDSEIATMSLRGSLMCPLGKIKMTLPCRALTCTHLQCFDATLYLQMNEKKPKWICPVCDKPALFKSLAIDGLFLDITRKAPPECTEVQFHENGSWTPVLPTKKIQEIQETTITAEVKVEPKPKKSVEVIKLDSDSDTEDSWPIQPPKKKTYKPVGIISPVVVDGHENGVSSDSILKYDMMQPCTSKSVPAASTTMPMDNNAISQQSVLSYPEYIMSGASPTINVPSSPTFSPQSPISAQPSSSTFQETVDILKNTTSSTAGQCSYDFDLYSLIQQNNEDAFQQFQESSLDENISTSQDTPDIISID